jgi:hypothetical protein
MSSLIPDYEYYILMSCHQKDNKGDMLVSKFIAALKYSSHLLINLRSILLSSDSYN